MNTSVFFLSFIIPCAITTAVLWICYRLFFGNSNRFQLNRYFLLSALIVALALPVIGHWMGQISPDTAIWKEELFGNTFMLKELVISADGTALTTSDPNIASNTSSQGFNFWHLALIIYIIGVGIASLLFFYKLIKIIVLTIRSPKEKLNGYTAVYTDGNHGSFSFLHFAYFPDKNVSSEIVRHELSHIEHHHTYDILLTEVMMILQWFNPFIYLYKRDLQRTHEYIADSDVLAEGIDKEKYMYLILQQCTAVDFSNMSNNFSLKSTKKRIKMMTSNTKTKGIWWKLMAMIPVLAILLFANLKTTAENAPSPIAEQTAISDDATVVDNTTTETVEQTIMDEPSTEPIVQKHSVEQPSQPIEETIVPDDSIYNQVEVMAEYPGGFEKMAEFLGKNIVYPEEAKKKNIQGTVLVSFVVEKNGKITDAKVVIGIGGGCDEEALRVVNAMPKWKPGKQGGKNVRVQFALPIKFKLQ